MLRVSRVQAGDNGKDNESYSYLGAAFLFGKFIGSCGVIENTLETAFRAWGYIPQQ